MATNPARQETDSLLEDLEKRIAKEYSQAADELQKKAHKYFQGFEERDKAKLALVNSGKLSQEDYLKWRSGAMMYDKRYTEMINDLTNTAVNADKAAMDIVNGSLPETFRINANYGAYEVERASGIDTNFTLYNKDAVADLIKNQPDLLPKPSVDIPLDKRWNRQHLNSAITQGILQGDSIDHIAKRLRSVPDMDRRAAIRNARTMTTAAENAGSMHSYKRAEEMGIKGKKMWMATHDNRTRESHAMMDGETRDLDEAFSNGLQEPGEIGGEPSEVYNCRCRIIYVSDRSQLKQYYDEQSKKVVIDGKSYDEWKQESYAKWAKRHETEQVDQVDSATYNDKTISTQIKETPAYNEYDYWSKEQEDYRFDAIKEQTGVDDEKATKILHAFSGDRNEYRGIDHTPECWFYRGDTYIRNMTEQKWEDAAKTIDEYVQLAPKYDETIYRGMALPSDLLNDMQVGNIFTEQGSLSSWTSTADVAEMFANGRSEELGLTPVIIETIGHKYATPVSHLSVFGSEENEVLVSNLHGNNYSILGRTEENGIVKIKLKWEE